MLLEVLFPELVVATFTSGRCSMVVVLTLCPPRVLTKVTAAAAPFLLCDVPSGALVAMSIIPLRPYGVLGPLVRHPTQLNVLTPRIRLHRSAKLLTAATQRSLAPTTVEWGGGVVVVALLFRNSLSGRPPIVQFSSLSCG